MKVTNKSARLFYLNGAHELLRLAPLQTLEVAAADEAAVLGALEGPLKHYIKLGDLVVESDATPTPSSSPPTAAPAEAQPAAASSDASTSAEPPAPPPPAAPTQTSSRRR